MRIKKKKIEHPVLVSVGAAIASFVIAHIVRSIPDMVRYYRISTM